MGARPQTSTSVVTAVAKKKPASAARVSTRQCVSSRIAASAAMKYIDAISL